MLIKILLKIWPALFPILIYTFWQIIIKRILNKISRKKYCAKTYNSQGKIIDGEKDEEKIVGAKTTESTAKSGATESNQSKIFSLENKNFVLIVYLSLILAILCVISFAF
jgi:hypothetical protein